MCIEDWRLGRLIRSQVNAKSATNGQTLTVNPNPLRVGIILSSTSMGSTLAAATSYAIDGVIVGVLPNGFPSVRFSLQNDGDLPTHGFTLTCGTAVGTLSIIELFLPEIVLKQSLDALAQD